jgi:hypothetical protein
MERQGKTLPFLLYGGAIFERFYFIGAFFVLVLVIVLVIFIVIDRSAQAHPHLI